MTATTVTPENGQSFLMGTLDEPEVIPALIVAPDGFWGNFCEEGHHFPRVKDANRWKSSRPDRCSECGRLPHGDMVGLLPSSLPLIRDPGAVRAVHWWHVTLEAAIRPLDPTPMHWGTEEAARDRGDHLFLGPRVERLFLFEATLGPSATIERDLIVERPWGNDGHRLAAKRLASASAVRYVNAQEAPGSISIFVRAVDLQIVARHEIVRGARHAPLSPEA